MGRAPADHAHDEHVGVVPVADSGEGGPAVLGETDAGYGLPGVADVAGGAPGVGKAGPVGRAFEGSVIGEAEDDIAAGIAKGFGHFFGLGRFDWIPVVLEIIDAPGGPLFGVFFGEVIFADGPGEDFFIHDSFFVLGGFGPSPVGVFGAAADVAGVGGGPGGGIDAGFEAHGVDLVAQAFHVGKFVVALDGAKLAAALALPGIVDVD